MEGGLTRNLAPQASRRPSTNGRGQGCAPTHAGDTEIWNLRWQSGIEWATFVVSSFKRRIFVRNSLAVVGATVFLFVLVGIGPVMPAQAVTAHATFAGGCFWCMQPPFDKQPGVISTTVGYTGGSHDNPTYEEVSAGGTGHAESIDVVYDPAKVSYDTLLDVFWHNVDPLTAEAQFCDHGHQYRAAIFYHDDEQRRRAEESKHKLEASKRFQQPIVTPIVAAGAFYPAEDYHQKYYEKNPVRYRYYRWGCGRDARLKEVWGGDVLAH
ncbi:MAG: peptide-methionine (S)-S-oxide reductase MsrA [Deltaproteobacteria bacterium]|nr:peptide-methionine (S)-S-oxide reductase MsrA [Deltaproteobacteria bacterium]